MCCKRGALVSVLCTDVSWGLCKVSSSSTSHKTHPKNATQPSPAGACLSWGHA